MGIDPIRVWGIFNLMTTSLLFCTVFPFSILSFVAILFHWYVMMQKLKFKYLNRIDLINISVTTLRKEEMLQKISIRYKPKDITLEDMVEKLKFLGRLKIPFTFLIVLLFVIIYATQIVAGLNIQVLLMGNIMFGVVFIYYTITCVGFLVYRKKLISIMPFELTKKVKKVVFIGFSLTFPAYGSRNLSVHLHSGCCDCSCSRLCPCP